MTSQDEVSIKAARMRSNDAIKTRDLITLTSIWTPDYHVITSRNFEASGRELNRIRFENEFETRSDVIYIRTPEKIEVFTQWNMAAETGTWVGRWTDKGSAIEVKGSYYAKWHKIDGEWMIRAEIFTPVSCDGGAFCEEAPL